MTGQGEGATRQERDVATAEHGTQPETSRAAPPIIISEVDHPSAAITVAAVRELIWRVPMVDRANKSSAVSALSMHHETRVRVQVLRIGGLGERQW